MNCFLKIFCFCFILLALPCNAHCDVEDPLVLKSGDFKVAAASGALLLDGEWTWGLEASVRVGLPFGFEIAGPLALGYEIIGTPAGSGFMIGAGVTDMWVTKNKDLLWTPALVAAMQMRVASTASIRASFDFTTVETNFKQKRNPAWIRTSLGLVVDMGPYLTWAIGMSYQRIVIENLSPTGIEKPGFAGNARVSIGSVRTNPFEELPTFAIHTCSWLDVILLFKMNIDTDLDTTDTRYLVGLRLKNSVFN